MKKNRFILILFLVFFLACSTKERVADEQRNFRLVALSPAMSEVLDLLCPDSIIVGRTVIGDFSDGMREKSVVVTYPRLDLEALLKLKPTHVFTSKGITSPDLLNRIKGYGIQVYESRNESVADIINIFEEIGHLSGCEERGVFIKDSLKEELNKFVISKKWNCLGVISTDPMYVYGGNTYFTDVISKLGGQNLVEEENFPIIDKELFLRLNPDKIITTNRQQLLDYYKGRSFVEGLRMMKDTTSIIVVNSDWLSRPNHNILKAMRQIEEQL